MKKAIQALKVCCSHVYGEEEETYNESRDHKSLYKFIQRNEYYQFIPEWKDSEFES
jgi:hypothetical protein